MTSIATKVSAVCIFSPHAVTVLRSPELTLQCIQNVFLHFAIIKRPFCKCWNTVIEKRQKDTVNRSYEWIKELNKWYLNYELNEKHT